MSTKKLPLHAKKHERAKHDRLKFEDELRSWRLKRKTIKDHELDLKKREEDSAEDDVRSKLWTDAGNKMPDESYTLGDAPWAKGKWTPPSYTERRIARVRKAKKR